MIPTIGIAVAAYIFLRCAELIAAHPSRFRTSGERIVVSVLAVVVMLLAGLSVLELFIDSSQVASSLQAMP